MKGPSEKAFAEALGQVEDNEVVTHWKPPDDARNWKPADFLVWIRTTERYAGSPASHPATLSFWFEVKQTQNLAQVDLWSLLTPVQRSWCRVAVRLGIRYWIPVYWAKAKRWTFHDANRRYQRDGWPHELIEGAQNPDWLARLDGNVAGSVIDSSPGQLHQTIRAILRGEVQG